MTKVLIVEDEIIIARELQSILVRLGYEIVGIADTAEKAFLLAEDFEAQVALVDVSIKGNRDGVTLAAHLGESLGVKIVFVTSNVDDGTLKRAAAIRPIGYVTKPFLPNAIAASLAIASASEACAGHDVDLERLSAASHHTGVLPEETVRAIDSFISRNLASDITIELLADISAMSRSEFSRRFKQTVGISPYQYVLRARLAEAKRLLRNTDWHLVDIALIVGFNSQSHFASSFKRALGITPLDYRKLD